MPRLGIYTGEAVKCSIRRCGQAGLRRGERETSPPYRSHAPVRSTKSRRSCCHCGPRDRLASETRVIANTTSGTGHWQGLKRPRELYSPLPSEIVGTVVLLCQYGMRSSAVMQGTIRSA
ncbi:hypothetical protein DOTSEDRAFT_73601 [Dothistroma septosporum NZE10]|uniref:Uncharacterized protein n=1 Tax=Dothistroma septosporum (strain NZE10 / CBS 128990) TaxID=675120 RepID=N1PIV5_DOTSN|nr:hypothetical protein DOTSEDRAFT_73601 [Dothistroma septosporum NZE10]